MPKYSKGTQEKMEKVMHEYKEGTLKSGKDGKGGMAPFQIAFMRLKKLVIQYHPVLLFFIYLIHHAVGICKRFVSFLRHPMLAK
jgi:hypothetical protein